MIVLKTCIFFCGLILNFYMTSAFDLSGKDFDLDLLKGIYQQKKSTY